LVAGKEKKKRRNEGEEKEGRGDTIVNWGRAMQEKGTRQVMDWVIKSNDLDMKR